jgi:WD40 repeat protein
MVGQNPLLAISSVAFSPDDKRIVTGSLNGTARLWDAKTGGPISEPLMGHTGSIESVAFSHNGKRVVTASADKTARLWDISANTQDLISEAKAVAPRCLTQEQRKAFFLPPQPPAWCIEMDKWPYDTPEWKQWLADVRAGKKPLPAD